MIRVIFRLSGLPGWLSRGILKPPPFRDSGPQYVTPIAERSGAPRGSRFGAARTKAYSPCPDCGSWRLVLSRRRSFIDGVKAVFGVHRSRCLGCGRRFHHHPWHWEYVRYARCPQCANLELCDWTERYALPPRHRRVLLLFGARPQRCAPCRLNFVAFRQRWQPHLKSARTFSD